MKRVVQKIVFIWEQNIMIWIPCDTPFILQCSMQYSISCHH